MTTTDTCVVWFRRDLRLADNPAWAASAEFSQVTALYVLDPRLFTPDAAFRCDQLLAHLRALNGQLSDRGGRLRIELGDPAVAVPRVAAEMGATVVLANADATPFSRRRDTAVNRALGDIELRTWWGTMVHHPGAVTTKAGTISLVFTPFSRTWSATPWAVWPEGDGANQIADTAGDELPHGNPAFQTGGESAALERLDRWLENVDDYQQTRDTPSIDGTSGLSADLRFGTLSPRRIVEDVGSSTLGRAGFVRQLAWRDWYAHLMWERPELVRHSLKPAFDLIVWRDDPAGLEAWQLGQTGYPIVDAGMRQLAATGWMHNRVRMIVASFLVKDLLIDWRHGERWFRHLLVDFDVTQNVGNWQWAAGTGPDAAPYFRIFNPITQSKKFDARGDYIRRWVPELVGMPTAGIHAPWLLPPLELAQLGVSLGDTYPHPIVDHAEARVRTLEAYALAKEQAVT